MRHINPNMCQPVLDGIAEGEANRDRVLFHSYLAMLPTLQALLVPTGDRPFVVAAYTKAKHLAFAQGFVAGYQGCRSGHTDCTVDCGWCKGGTR